MNEHDDPALEAFRNRDPQEALSAFMAEQELLGKHLVESGNKPV